MVLFMVLWLVNFALIVNEVGKLQVQVDDHIYLLVTSTSID